MGSKKYIRFSKMTKDELNKFADSIKDQPRAGSYIVVTEVPDWWADLDTDPIFLKDFTEHLGKRAKVLGPDRNDPDSFIIEFDDGMTCSVYTDITKVA
jgi:hypothetical protein